MGKQLIIVEKVGHVGSVWPGWALIPSDFHFCDPRQVTQSLCASFTSCCPVSQSVVSDSL